MSSGCGDVLSLADLQTAKKHQIFEAEVITGKSGGVAGGADIDYATNQVTGQTQKTLPAVLRDFGFSPVAWDFSTGGTLTVNDRDKVVYDPVSKTWYSYAGTLPVTVPAGFNPVGNADWKPQTDPLIRNDLSNSADVMKGDALVAIKQPLANSSPRTQHDKNIEFISVKDFGAVGDGITDDTSAIQNALNAVKNFSAMLFIPSGTYLISDTLTIYSETVVVGSGRCSVIKMAPNVNKDILKSVNADNLWGVTDKSVLDSAEQLYDLTLRDFVIDGGVTDWSDKPTGNGISIWGSRLDFSGIGIFNIAGCGLRTEFSDNGMPYQKQWIESSFHNIRIERCGMECWKFRGPADAKANMISLLDGSRYGHSLYSGLDVANHGATFANVHVSHDYNDPRGYVRHFAAVRVSAPSSFVSGCQFEGAKHANLLISDTSNVNFGADTNIYAAYSDCNVRLAGNVSKILLLGLISSPMSTSSGSNGIVCDSTARISNSTIQMTMWGQSRTSLVLGDSADVGGNSICITSHSDDGTLYAGKLNTAAGSVYDLKMLGSSSVRSFVNSSYQKIRITAAANAATSVTFPLVCGATPYIMVQPVDASSDVDKLLVPVNVSNAACKVYNPNSFSIDCFLIITSM